MHNVRLAILVLLLVAACHSKTVVSAPQADPPRTAVTNLCTALAAALIPADAAAREAFEKKVSPLLCKTLRDILAAERAAGTAGGVKYEIFSSALVHVDAAGRIQVYIKSDPFDAEVRAQLESLGVAIELENARARIVQGWVPHERVSAIAGLKAVQKISPAGYATLNR